MQLQKSVFPELESMDIFFEGRVETELVYDKVIGSIVEYAVEAKWQYSTFKKNVTVIEGSYEDGVLDYVGPTKGIELYPNHLCEWVNFEFVHDYSLFGSVKTRYAPHLIHMCIIDLLDTIEPYFDEFSVIDLMRYKDDRDEQALQKIMLETRERLDETREYEGRIGPTRTENGQIYD